MPLDELAALANEVLASLELEVMDGRASSRIDSRTIRFYQSLGLLPKPQYEGRRALYSLTHLVRLIAAKRLQSEGHTLAQIQNSLPLRTDAQLMRALGELRTGTADGSSAPPHTDPTTGPATTRTHPSELRAFTLAKGVSLVIDPILASPDALDPHALAAAIASALNATSHRPHSGEDQ